MVQVGFWTLWPMLALFIVAGILTDSSTILAIMIQFAVSIAVSLFALITLRTALHQNLFNFPYGAGKLENFSAFLQGALLAPSAAYLIYSSTLRVITPGEVGYGLGLIAVGISLLRGAYLWWWVSSLRRRFPAPSPLLQSYYVDYKWAAISDIGIILAFLLASLLLRWGSTELGLRADPLLAIIIASLLLQNSIVLVIRNFRSLVDLPLPEADQLKILQALARHHEHYENIGTIYSRSSGKTRFIELELVFPAEISLEAIEILRKTMETDLSRSFRDLSFRIIPLQRAGTEKQIGDNH
jgi:cation diffusion facilitator family transporter